MVVLILVLAWAGYRTRQQTSCSSQVAVTVAAAPEIAPAVQDVATHMATDHPAACASVTVTAADPGDVAAAIAEQRGSTLTGLGKPNGNTRVPNVWIPDSSSWLTRLHTLSADLVPPGPMTSIATSPIVLAVPQPIAQTLGSPAAGLTWTALLQKLTGGATLKAGIVEPGRDAASLSTLLALNAAAASTGQSAQPATVAALRGLAVNRSALRADLLARFPRAGDPATLTAALSAAPLPEHAVITYNASRPPVPLAAVALNPAPAPLDYPFVTLPGAQSAVAAATTALQAALTGTAFRDQLAHLGLRAADGSTGAGFNVSAAASTPTAAPKPVPADPVAVQQALSTWATITQSGRILAVIDVSGSMLTPVPTAGGATREQVTVRAAAGGLSLFDDTWAVGLWTFSTNMDGAIPYKQLIPIGPLSSQRPQLTAALATVAANPRGDTALYQTLLAAYQTVQAGWDSSKVNSVVLMTDGMNDNPGGMTLDQLTSSLKKIADPHKPVQIIILGIGTEVPQAEMQAITQITGGGVFIATDPASIGQIFLQAIALRPGTVNGN